MNEFKKLSWRTDVNDSELNHEFLPEEAISSLYVYKSFDNPIKAKKKIKLHVSNEKYVPGLKEYCRVKKRSLLTKIEKFYCLAALKLIQSGKRQDLVTQKDKYYLKVYNECHTKIVEENRLFNELIKDMWLKRKIPPKIAPGLYTFAWHNCKKNLSRYLEYSQYYKEIATVSFNFVEDEALIDFQHIVQPLEVGTLARYAQATLKEKCVLKMNILRKITPSQLLNSKQPVSQDDNIIKLAENYNFDVAISSNSLKQIIDYTNIKTKWIIPVIIKEVTVKQSDGTVITKKIVFIDKVLPKVHPTNFDLKMHSYKRLLRLQFCQYEAFSYPCVETPIENMIATDDLPDDSQEEKTRTIHHNANYRIWNIKKTFIQNTLLKNQIKDRHINLLVRCKLDACEDNEQGALIPVIIRPKIEHQIQYGVTIPSRSELAHDWTSLFFRLYSILYRARIHSAQNEIISIEKCTIQKINNEAQTHYNYKPILGLGVLQKILAQLIDLDCGSYILQHLPKHEAFVAVMRQCDESGESSFDLHNEGVEPCVDSKCQPPWLPIDVNYILPCHEEFETLPGLFHGFDNKETGAIKRKKKGKKRKQEQHESV